jgi:hypothetical protein
LWALTQRDFGQEHGSGWAANRNESHPAGYDQAIMVLEFPFSNNGTVALFIANIASIQREKIS